MTEKTEEHKKLEAAYIKLLASYVMLKKQLAIPTPKPSPKFSNPTQEEK